MLPKIKLGFCIFLLSVVFGCNHYDLQTDIINTWKVREMKIATNLTDSLPENAIWREVDFVDDIYYKFEKDGTYQIFKNNQSDQGTWKLSADNKVLILFSELNKKDNIEFIVEHFTDFNLTLNTHEKGSMEKIILSPEN